MQIALVVFMYIQFMSKLHFSYIRITLYSLIILMSKAKEFLPKIKISTFTWYKDSHSLYDYESSKITQAKFQFDFFTKGINLYRKKIGSQILAIDPKKIEKEEFQDYEFIGHFQLDYSKANGFKVNALSVSTYKDKSKTNFSEKQKTNQSIDNINSKEEDPYFIVGRGNAINQSYGCKLQPGMTLKLGRIQYYVSQSSNGTNKNAKPMQNSKFYFNENIFRFTYDPNIKRSACKICLEQHNLMDNFLFNPCKCNGSCGSVHYECLIQWIRIKVKKEVVGGTQHYNFTKFECEVCKTEFPGYIEVSDENNEKKQTKQMIGVQKPQGNYIILQGACQKQKSIMVIQNTPVEGIKVGRGHECQIRITDISVSRKHAIIRTLDKDFYIYDNKSKFGTLIRDESMSFQVKKQIQKKHTLQIGRTIIQFELGK